MIIASQAPEPVHGPNSWQPAILGVSGSLAISTLRGPEDVQIYALGVDQFRSWVQSNGLLTVLTATELVRATRARSAEDRDLRCASRLLVRLVLAAILDVPPRSLALWPGHHGQLCLWDRAGIKPWFSIARTTGMTVVATSNLGPLGVDIEQIGRILPIAADQAWLAPREKAADRRSGHTGSEHRLLERWTLKEAYVKALGVGLHLSPDQLAFDLKGRQPTLDLVGPTTHRVSASWEFRQFEMAPDIVGAVALEREDASPLSEAIVNVASRPLLHAGGSLRE